MWNKKVVIACRHHSVETDVSVGEPWSLPADAVESHQTKEICKADPRSIEGKGYKDIRKNEL